MCMKGTVFFVCCCGRLTCVELNPQGTSSTCMLSVFQFTVPQGPDKVMVVKNIACLEAGGESKIGWLFCDHSFMEVSES